MRKAYAVVKYFFVFAGNIIFLEGLWGRQTLPKGILWR